MGCRLCGPSQRPPRIITWDDLSDDNGQLTIRLATEAVVTRGTRVACAVRLAAGLAPDERIGQRVARARCRPDTKASTLDVAPVAPLGPQPSDGVAARVDDGIAGHTRGLQEGREGVDVYLLVLALVVLGVRGVGELARAQVPRIPPGNVGGEPTELLRAAACLVGLRELFGTRLQVGVPCEVLS